MKTALFSFTVYATILLAHPLRAQFHGIDSNWYASPVQFTPAVAGATCGGAVANNTVVKGDTVIIFYKENGQNSWAGSVDGGITWTSPSPAAVTPSQGMPGASTISTDIDLAGNIHIIWSAASPAGLFYSNYSAITQSWSTYQQINDTIYTSLKFGQITHDRKGRLHVMWQDGDHNATSDTARVFYVRSTDGGTTWSAQTMLSDANGLDDAFPVADFGGTSSDTLVIPWRQNTGGGLGWEVKGVISYNGGSTWSAPATLAGGGGDQWDPNLVIDRNGITHLFYHLYPNPNPNYMAYIQYRYSANGGTTWSPVDTISDTLYRSHLIKTAYDHTNNIAWCFWKDERDFDFGTGNPEADIIGSYIVNNGSSYTVSPTEFISDGDSTEYGYHNFKVGADGIVRAHFVTIENGQPKDLYYTQRSAPAVGVTEHMSDGISVTVQPNPFSESVLIRTGAVLNNATGTLYNAYGHPVRIMANLSGRAFTLNRSGLPGGVYLLRVVDGNKTLATQKVLVAD